MAAFASIDVVPFKGEKVYLEQLSVCPSAILY